MKKQLSEFEIIYQSEFYPILKKYEKVRKKYLFQLQTLNFVLIIATIFIIVRFTTNIEHLHVYYLITLSPIIAMYYFSKLFNYVFKKYLKHECQKNIIEKFSNIHWCDQPMYNETELFYSQLFGKFDKKENEDAFYGEHDGVKFKIEEMTLDALLAVSKSGKEYIPIFEGIVINFQNNKTNNSRTIITGKNDLRILNFDISKFIQLTVFAILFVILFHADRGGAVPSNHIINLLANCAVFLFIAFILTKKTYRQKNKMPEIKLEDPLFAKYFRVYSNDQIESRYMITSSFMERYLNIKNVFKSKSVKCAFYGNQIMFAIYTNKDLFEIGNLFHPMSSPKQLKELFTELDAILGMVGHFKLDQKIGM